MGGDALHTILQHLLARAHAPAAEAVPDASLLERFATHGDESAFETLVRRHGPLVLSACRGVLRNPADADDVFQATFLVLARKAGAIREQNSVGSWLYGVAQRIALNVRARAARQRARERQAADMPRPQANDELERQELRQILGEELQHLPEEYRTALVLFYLEGKSYEETARTLRCPVGTVRSRLARGRKALHGRLAGRGLALPFQERTPGAPGGVPDVLVTATVKAALPGGASARVLALAEEALRGLALSNFKGTLAVLLVVGLLAAAAGLLVGRDRPPVAQVSRAGPKAPVRPERPAVLGVPRLDVAGRVLDTTGQPVPGATVHLREWTVWPGVGPAIDLPVTDILATARTDTRGAFAFRGVLGRPFSLAWQALSHPWEVVVLAPGRGLAWQHLTPQVQKAGLLTFRLGRAAPVRGRVMDTAGRPIAGATVRVASLVPLADQTRAAHEGLLRLQHSRVVLQARSDAEGRFAVDGLPAGMRVRLVISSATHLGQRVQAATADDPQPNQLGESSYGGKTFRWLEPVLSGDWSVTLEPGRRVRGRVVAADTGLPVAGAHLQAGVATTTTDLQGRFTLGLLPLGPSLVCARGPDDGDFLLVGRQLPPSPAGEEQELTLALPRGVVVCGRVVDQDTRQGVARAQVCRQVRGKSPGQRALLAVGQTDARGDFRIVVPAGPAEVRVNGGQGGYHGQRTQALDLQPGRPVTGLTFALRRGVVVQGRTVDSQGRGVKGAELRLAHESLPAHPPWGCVTGDEGTFTLSGLPPGIGYEWIVTHPTRPLGARLAQTLPADRKDPLRVEIRLAPLARVQGRALDARQTPLAGATVRVVAVWRPPGRDQDEEVEVAALTTDARGRFRFDRLLPDVRQRYLVEVQARGHVGRRSAVLEMVPGPTRRLPDLVLPTAATVSGTVLDAAGRPLADVRVRVRPGAADPFLVFPAAALTARDGRFCLTGVPAGLLELEAEHCVAGTYDATNRPRPATTVKVEAGGGDARVVLRLEPNAR
jgi:RNA polymerase sigma factor (sigma-70 family)